MLEKRVDVVGFHVVAVTDRERERLLVGTGVALGADQNTRAGPSTTTLTRAAFAEAVVSAGSSWDREHPHVPIVHNYTT